MPDIVVNVHRLGKEESVVGIVREVLMDGSCRIVLGDNGETMTALLMKWTEKLLKLGKCACPESSQWK
ncbi:putative transcription elongation factor spt5 like protein 1 [Quercus suber]|uniref:Transcription elongation factor spt5 like protein 1 n=1 Tax=Quercus suber TaxID=58331 RepID=A0AAW0JZY0_QUESU